MVNQATRTILDDTRDEGERIGEKRGEKRGVLKALRLLLEKQLGPQLFYQIEPQLAAASADELDAWIIRVAQGDDPKEIFLLHEPCE